MVKSIRNIFPHGRQTDQGVGDIRIGQATVVVALDGSGDAESIQEGIDLLESEGGTVYIKEGVYNLKSSANIKVANTSLIGAGNSTIIKPTSALASFVININDKDNCIVKDLQIDGTNKITASGINLINSDFALITGCIIKNMSNNSAIDVDTTNDSRFIGNDFSNSEGLNIATANRCTFIGNLGAAAITLSANSNQNMFTGNYFGDVIISAATEDNNILVANNYDSMTDGGTGSIIANNYTY